MRMFSRISLVTMTVLYGFLQPVYADALPTAGGNYGDVATVGSLEMLFANFIRAIVALAGIALFIMLLIGGFGFLFAGGDQKKLETARGTLTNAIMGLVIIVAAYLILRIIGVFTGLTNTITTFSVPITK